ncbi:hypothetical protein PMZ80_009140 [Knufia obscura]|uniref:Uncharacterized protein n=2 Tax=Knufia TaxID=430999 RepID=A0AAN8I6Q7_9EURO|nr:hypothetical protein PMZ80_009140 [Knufia obscura]KAK5954904.1 hypothetical protein OHC33_003583 [Knufia fluminis]
MAPEGGQKKPGGSSADQPPVKRPSQPPSIQEEDEEEATSPSTVRRASAVRQGSTADQPRHYGTLESSDTGTTRRRNPLSRGPSALASPAIRRDPMASPGFSSLSPQMPRAQRRPSTIRRQSTNRKPLPHRGEQFSVDDDPSEVEDDRGQNRNEDLPQLTRTNTVRRRTVHVPQLPRVDSQEEDEDDGGPIERSATADLGQQNEDADADEEDELTAAEEDDDDDLSDAESFTLKDRQLAINETHPFGIRIWKPALYKKNRSVEKNAEDDIHSSPSQIVGKWLWLFNCLWTILFGWWLAAAAAFSGLVCFIFPFEPSAAAYGRTFFGLARYLFWPFGQFVKLEQDDNYAEEDEGEGRSISEYERWQSGDLEYGRLMFGPNVAHTGSIVGRHRNSIDSASETDSLLGRNGRPDHTDTDLTSRKRRLFGRGQWTLGRIIFFAFFYFFVAPLMLMVSLLCWFMVFWIPMGRVLTILFHHVRKRPLALTFHPNVSYARDSTKPSSIILCTYRAAGFKYWKYTLDGTNIFLINFLSVVAFVIIDYFFISEVLAVESWITSPALLFILGLVSIIPLAYFIGQAVASISAQSSMGLGAVINAFFSTVVEVFLYCVALKQGKSRLVEGSIVGSIFAGILLLPGLSMCFGAIRRKTQRFNVKSAGATSTMLLFAMIAAFGPTLFFKIYGAHELICKTCTNSVQDEPRDCRQCYFRQLAAPDDLFFVQAVQPYCWIAAVLLFLSYVIGLLFTLRTHAAVIWQTDLDEKKPVLVAPTTDISPADTRGQSIYASQTLNGPGPHTPKPAIRDSQMYKRILDRSLRSAGLEPHNPEGPSEVASTTAREESGVATHDHGADDLLPHVVPPKVMSPDKMLSPEMRPVVPGLSDEDNQNLLRQVAAMASTAATVAARDAVNNPRQTSYMTSHSGKGDKRRPSTARLDTIFDAARLNEQHPTSATAEHQDAGHAGGGHDAPNWSRTKSAAILLTATLAYAAVAEILVDTVDVILSSVEIDEKFLGITLFALVPNTTEFLNAISFAMNGNIALSMEIGSAYVLQVALLQIPALVLFSAVYQAHLTVENLADYTFNLIFPQWDMVTVILCVFLLSYVNTEGKSNYFKGSILVMAYLVILMGFYYSGFTGIDVLGVDPGDTLALTVSSWESLRANAARSRVEL